MATSHGRKLNFFASLTTPLKRFFIEIAGVQDRRTREADLWMEAEERLAQIDFLLGRVKTLQRRTAALLVKAAAARNRTEANYELLVSRALAFEIKLYAEAFYYFAARFIKILRCFTQLKNFEAPGIRDVRNRLLEHSETADGTTQQDWSIDSTTGIALKSVSPRPRGKDHVPKDAGLYANATELRDRLARRLEQLLPPADHTPS